MNEQICINTKLSFDTSHFHLACECNSQGSTRYDGSACFKKCCNDNGSCTCKMGYIGDKCNDCDERIQALENEVREIRTKMKVSQRSEK